MTKNIKVNEQNSIKIKSKYGMIYVDPFRIREKTNDAAFILITHDHYDHFSPEDIAKVAGKNTVLVVPEKMEGKHIYVAGDTDATKEAKAVKCDIAIVPVGGTYTMDAKKAAELVNTLRPNVAIPVHYGSVVGSPKNGEVFAENVMEPIKVEFKIRF